MLVGVRSAWTTIQIEIVEIHFTAERNIDTHGTRYRINKNGTANEEVWEDKTSSIRLFETVFCPGIWIVSYGTAIHNSQFAIRIESKWKRTSKMRFQMRMWMRCKHRISHSVCLSFFVQKSKGNELFNVRPNDERAWIWITYRYIYIYIVYIVRPKSYHKANKRRLNNKIELKCS